MKKMSLEHIFSESFETFKVFETIPYEISGVLIKGHSTSIWQILNHLIIWQSYQISALTKVEIKEKFDEAASWIEEQKPSNQLAWNESRSQFKKQIEKIKELVIMLDQSSHPLNEKIKIFQNISTHLSFHLGEIILLARLEKKYPQPNEMAGFLSDEMK